MGLAPYAGIHRPLLRIPSYAGIHEPRIAERAMLKTYYLYIMANKKNGTLYVGVTNDLIRRIWEHKNDVHEGFTKKYGLHRLVWYESTTDIEAAIRREKQLKKWNRQWKIELIEKENPNWDDLYEGLL